MTPIANHHSRWGRHNRLLQVAQIQGIFFGGMANGFPDNGVDCESELENHHRNGGSIIAVPKQMPKNEALDSLDVSGDSDGYKNHLYRSIW